jgi:hypothetical protein
MKMGKSYSYSVQPCPFLRRSVFEKPYSGGQVEPEITWLEVGLNFLRERLAQSAENVEAQSTAIKQSQ